MPLTAEMHNWRERPAVTVSKLPEAAGPSRRVGVERLSTAEVAAKQAALRPSQGDEKLPPDEGSRPTAAGRDPASGVHPGDADWLGQLLAELWPYARDAAQKYCWETIPQELDASRPEWLYDLRMERFELGEARPAVRGISVHRGDGGGVEELYVEFEAEWHSEQDVSLLIQVPRLPVWLAEITPDKVEDALRLAMELRVSLKDAWVRAGVRVTLRPLLHRLPVVGAVQVGLTRVPEFGYELDLSIASAALVPLVKEWLDGAVRDLVLQPWVLPEHAFFPLEPGAQDVERPSGVLAVRVVGAEDVPSPGLFAGSPQPMLELFLRDSQRRQTTVAPAGSSASWDQRFEFPVSLPEHQELSVILYSFSSFTPNEELGRAQLAVRDLPPGQEREVVLTARAIAEEHHEEEKGKLSVGGRIAMALARPFTKKGSEVCKMRLQVTYIPLSKAEAAAVMAQQRLPAPQRGDSSSGTAGAATAASLHPLALRLLRSGLLVVHVTRADGVLSGGSSAGSMFKPYLKVVLRLGERQSESDASQASRQGAVEFSRPVMMHLDAEAVQGAEGAQVELELLEHAWTGSDNICGRLSLPLGELVRGGRVEGERRLEGRQASGRSGGRVQLSAHFRPYF